ncbi:hypothetical protein AB9W60_003786 [Proteus mirabilis]|nr:hypothetical protein [Proteus mirabilis]
MVSERRCRRLAPLWQAVKGPHVTMRPFLFLFVVGAYYNRCEISSGLTDGGDLRQPRVSHNK